MIGNTDSEASQAQQTTRESHPRRNTQKDWTSSQAINPITDAEDAEDCVESLISATKNPSASLCKSYLYLFMFLVVSLIFSYLSII